MLCGPPSVADLKRIYDQAALLAKVGAWECDLETEELTWTDGVYDLFELPRGSRPRRSAVVELYCDESRPQMEAMRAQTIGGGGGFVLDAEIRTTRGASRWMRLSADVAHENGRPVRLFGAKQDITHERELWARLRELAERDSLTGLANRGVFETRCRELIKEGRACPSVSALALVDVDHFKQINDRLGHSAGDECLREVAGRLCRAFGDAILVSRIGGDEFAVLLRAPLDRLQILRLARRALHNLSRPVLWKGLPIETSVSIGLALLERPHFPGQTELFAQADCALYLAKAAGRNAVRIFEAVIDDAVRRSAGFERPGQALRYG